MASVRGGPFFRGLIVLADMSSAIRFFYSGNLVEAESILSEILTEDRYNINALLRYGAVLEGLDKLREAGNVYLKLAQMYFRERSYAESLEVLEKAITYLPEADNPLLLKGYCLYYLGRYAEALPFFADATIVEVDNLFYAGKIRFALKRYREAEQDFLTIKEKAIKREDSLLADYWLGKTYYALRRFDEAISRLRSYNKAFPEDKQVFLDLALCYIETGAWDEAEKRLNAYRDKGGNKKLADLNLGVVFFRKGEYLKALEHLNNTPSSAQSLHWKGLAYYSQGLYPEAIDCLTELVKLVDNPYFYYKIMGNAHLKLGNYYEAKMLVERVLDDNPDDPEMDKILVIVRHYLKEATMSNSSRSPDSDAEADAGNSDED